MKNAIKKTGAFCGGALIVIASCLEFMGLSQRTAHAETDCLKESLVHNTEQNIGTYNSDIFSLQTSMDFGIMPLFNPYPSYSYDEVDSLLGSTVYGGWNDSFTDYNCYAYALGRSDDRFNIGKFSNHSLNTERYKGVYYLKNSIEELRDYTIQQNNANIVVYFV